METDKCHGGHVVCVCTELPLACYNHKQFYQETLSEALCGRFQTCFFVDFHFILYAHKVAFT